MVRAYVVPLAGKEVSVFGQFGVGTTFGLDAKEFKASAIVRGESVDGCADCSVPHSWGRRDGACRVATEWGDRCRRRQGLPGVSSVRY
jgi:hypothetical protein